MDNQKTYRLDGSPFEKYAASALRQLRSGDYLCFQMTSDDLIKEYASAEDYKFWMAEK